jgi:hypothetical protein
MRGKRGKSEGGSESRGWEVGVLLLRGGNEGPTECWVSHCIFAELTKAEIHARSTGPTDPSPSPKKQNNGLGSIRLKLEENVAINISCLLFDNCFAFFFSFFSFPLFFSLLLCVQLNFLIPHCKPF